MERRPVADRSLRDVKFGESLFNEIQITFRRLINDILGLRVTLQRADTLNGPD